MVTLSVNPKRRKTFFIPSAAVASFVRWQYSVTSLSSLMMQYISSNYGAKTAEGRYHQRMAWTNNNAVAKRCDAVFLRTHTQRNVCGVYMYRLARTCGLCARANFFATHVQHVKDEWSAVLQHLESMATLIMALILG